MYTEKNTFIRSEMYTVNREVCGNTMWKSPFEECWFWKNCWLRTQCFDQYALIIFRRMLASSLDAAQIEIFVWRYNKPFACTVLNPIFFVVYCNFSLYSYTHNDSYSSTTHIMLHHHHHQMISHRTSQGFKLWGYHVLWRLIRLHFVTCMGKSKI